MPDLGKAFVQIVPSAEGISGSITDVLRGEADNAGSESGSIFSEKLVYFCTIIYSPKCPQPSES